ncbi:unnamed protein product [Cuscuta epithymum]|nr:unnamed protein product [Cuscuta epithymum]
MKERCSAPRKSPRFKSKHNEMEGNNEQPDGESRGRQKTVAEVEKPTFTHRKKLFGSVPRRSPQHISKDTLGQANAHSHDMDMNEEEDKSLAEPKNGKEQSIDHMENERVEGKEKQGCDVVFVNEKRTGMKAKSPLNVQRMTRSVAEKRKEQSANMMMFCILVENCLGEMNSIKQDAEIFGFQTKSIFNKEVCRLVINFEQVSNSVVEIWARHLHEKMEADGGDMPVQFGTSAAIAIPKKASHQAITRRSQYIADLLDISLPGQMTLIPYNTGNHWVLVAIDMMAQTVYYLDSIGGIPTKDLEEIVNQGVTINHAQKSKTRLNLKWVRVMCPKQTGVVECGYFLMKYMKDIVSDVNLLKRNFSTIKEYTEDDILRVREEWALYAATLIKNLQADPTKA